MATTPQPTRLTAKTPDDLLAAVPVVLGFEPSDSVVMLTFGGGEPFHARVDLPPPDEIDVAVESLHEPARRHRVESVVFVLYTHDEGLSRRVQGRLVRRFERTGIQVVEVIRTDGARWYAPGRRGVPAGGVPYDWSGHPFLAQSVLDGRVIHGSREGLAAMLAPGPEVAAVERARVEVSPYTPPEVAAVVADALDTGRFTDEQLAALLLALRNLEARDAAWAGFERETAEDHVRLWTDAVQRSPEDLVATPAAVLGMAAWLSGHGALAWCAVDRCQVVEPDNSLARLVADLLADAIPPSARDQWGPSAELEGECG